MSAALRIADLSIGFTTQRGITRVLDAVSLDLERGTILGLVGESGSGKTLIAKAALGILPPAARITRGSIEVEGTDMVHGASTRLRAARGRQIAMIFQNPRSSLNPIRTAGRQIEDVIRAHEGGGRRALRTRALDALASVRIDDPERVYQSYPFELSGGMAQRVMIAIAIACRPAVLVADEPTTGLDASIRASVMELIRGLARSRNLAVVLITHDLAVAEDYCDAIAVMHAGHLVERAPTRLILHDPKHPYTAALKAATPGDPATLAALRPIPGSVPDLGAQDLPCCRFAGRCPSAEARCLREPLPFIQFGREHMVRCHHVLA